MDASSTSQVRGLRVLSLCRGIYGHRARGRRSDSCTRVGACDKRRHSECDLSGYPTRHRARCRQHDRESDGRSDEEALAALVRTNPQRRLIQPHEVCAGSSLWLCGPHTGITGQCLHHSPGEVMGMTKAKNFGMAMRLSTTGETRVTSDHQSVAARLATHARLHESHWQITCAKSFRHSSASRCRARPHGTA